MISNLLLSFQPRVIISSIFLIDWWMLYNIGLISAIYHHELAIRIHMSAPSWVSLLPPAQSHCSRLLQSPSLSSLSHIAPWAVYLQMSVYKLPCCCLHSSRYAGVDCDRLTMAISAVSRIPPAYSAWTLTCWSTYYWSFTMNYFISSILHFLKIVYAHHLYYRCT